MSSGISLPANPRGMCESVSDDVFRVIPGKFNISKHVFKVSCAEHHVRAISPAFLQTCLRFNICEYRDNRDLHHPDDVIVDPIQNLSRNTMKVEFVKLRELNSLFWDLEDLLKTIWRSTFGALINLQPIKKVGGDIYIYYAVLENRPGGILKI